MRHSPSFSSLVLIIGCLLSGTDASATPATPAPLGRIFFTPDMRAKLDSQRKLNVKETRSLEGESIRLDGIVSRSSGKSTVWINNQPQHENDVNTSVTARIARQRPERATLSTSEDAAADLKVGVTINRATRETQGGLDAGEIRVNRVSSGKPQ